MTQQRPGFVSRNTDDFSNPNASEKTSAGVKDHKLDDASKPGAEVDIQAGELHLRRAFAEQDEDDYVESNVPVETAADLVTQIIHLDDDPDEKCLTFRTWFLGRQHSCLNRLDLLINNPRDWPLNFCICPARDLLLQASDHLRVPGILDRHSVCTRRRYGGGYPSERLASSPEPSRLYSKRARCYHYHGFSSRGQCSSN
jgi:hypothetical protein